MRTQSVLLGSALVSLLIGCSSPRIVLAPFGPSPVTMGNTSGNGQLEVFSAMRGHTEGNNPTWFQHTDYYIYNEQNHPLKHVNNNLGHYERPPRIINLAPGKYIVKSRAKDYFWVKVPVVISSGKITEVHLDNAWTPSPETNPAELVMVPAGYPVGWRTNLAQ